MNNRTKAIKQKGTKKQQSLIEALEEGKPPAEAFKLAGYAGNNQTNVMSHPIVQKALEAIEGNTQQLTSLTREDVIEGMLSAILMAEALEDPPTMIKGWSEIAKLHGYYAAEKKEVSYTGEISHDHSGQVDLAQLPTSKLLEMSSKSDAIDISPDDYKWGAEEASDEEESSDDFFDPTEDNDESETS